MQNPTKKRPELTRNKRVAKYAAIAGVLLALACPVMPPKYQAVCNLVAQIAPHACN